MPKFTPPTITEIKKQIERSRKLPQKIKDFILPLVSRITEYHNGRVYYLNVPAELKKVSSKSRGVLFGAAPDGYFVHTHRARSKSKKTVSGITKKEIESIETTG